MSKTQEDYADDGFEASVAESTPVRCVSFPTPSFYPKKRARSASPFAPPPLPRLPSQQPSAASPALSGHPFPGIVGVPPPDVAFSPASLAGARGVDPEVLSLLAGFSPARVELFPALRPFLPEFLPAAGDIDAFLKPPRPDGAEDELGAKRLDEPAALQSDPTVLDLQLRALSKKSGLDPVAVRALENADKNPKEVLKWVASIAELRRAAPPPSVRYSKPMPEVDALMQVWPEEFEAMLRAVPLPPADLEVGVEEYARIVCGLLDIPVHGGGGGGGAGAAAGGGPGPLIEALHLLFTLYAEFAGNAHLGGGGGGV